MEIAIAGANGFVGSMLTRHFESRGHAVRRIVRGKPESPQSFKWDPAKGAIDPRGIEGADAVINVSGANVAGARWTEARMREIRDSRVLGTKLIAETIAAAKAKPRVLVNASGAGYYGTHPEGWVDEASPRGDGFLAGICEEWERVALSAADAFEGRVDPDGGRGGSRWRRRGENAAGFPAWSGRTDRRRQHVAQLDFVSRSGARLRANAD